MDVMLNKSWHTCDKKLNRSYQQFTALCIWSIVIAKYRPVKYVLFTLYEIFYKHFTLIHRSLLRTVECIFNRPITNFYNSDNVNISVTELLRTKTRPICFVMKRNLSYE